MSNNMPMGERRDTHKEDGVASLQRIMISLLSFEVIYFRSHYPTSTPISYNVLQLVLDFISKAFIQEKTKSQIFPKGLLRFCPAHNYRHWAVCVSNEVSMKRELPQCRRLEAINKSGRGQVLGISKYQKWKSVKFTVLQFNQSVPFPSPSTSPIARFTSHTSQVKSFTLFLDRVNLTILTSKRV
jgi:hypothetical protein